MQRALFGVSAVTLLSYAGEYMAFTAILALIVNLLIRSGMSVLAASGYSLLVSSVYLLASGVLAVPFGSLSDRFGRRNLAIVGCVGAAVSMVAMNALGTLGGSAEIIVVSSLLLLILGVGHATYTTSALAYAGDISSEKDVGEIYGLVETAEYAMFMFGTPLGLVLAQAYGVESTLLITGVLMLLGAGAAAIAMPEVPHTNVLGGSAGKSTGLMGLLVHAVEERGVLLALLSIFFVSVGFTIFRVYFSAYGTTGQAVPFPGPYLVSIMAAASIVGAIPIGRAVDMTKRRAPFIIAGFVGEAACLAFIIHAPTALSLFAWSILFGFTIMLVRVPQAVLIAEKTVFENRAGAMGVNHGVEHVGYGVGAFLPGYLIVAFSFSNLDTFVLVAGILAVFAVAIIPLVRRSALR